MNKNSEHVFTNEELKDLMKNVIENYHQTNSNRYEIINYKLDSIESQTTKTNGRLTDVEKKVADLELDAAKRILTCPQEAKIKELIETSTSTSAMRKLVIRGITIAGVFFAILFSLLKLLVEGGVF
jgi:hypothetical protein